MRDRRHRGVVLTGLRRNHYRTAVQGQVHYLREDRGVDVGVHTDDPGRIAEQGGVSGLPARVCGAGHRMATDVAVEQSGRAHQLQHRALDADDVGQRAAVGELLDTRQQPFGRGHRDREHDQRVPARGPGQRLREVGGGGKAIRFGRLGPQC